jgi:polyisoprenyl-phosphate glycosyltransferase
MTDRLLSVIVPCYNEEESLDTLYARLIAACTPYMDKGYEIIFINDGSHDATWSIIERFHDLNENVVGIAFARNFGHAMALTAGLEVSRGERVLIIDADLQDPPELLPKMMELLDRGADVAYGKRISRKGETWLKRYTAYLFYRLLNYLSTVPLPKDTGDFRLINRKVVDVLNSMPEVCRYIRGMVAWVGFNQQPILYERDERFAGETHYTVAKMFRLAMDAITGFSTRPLRMAFYFGFLMFGLCISFLIYVCIAYFRHLTIQGWASLACLISAVQAIQFILIGLIGEYVGRIYQQVKYRPKYIIAKRCGK